MKASLFLLPALHPKTALFMKKKPAKKYGKESLYMDAVDVAAGQAYKEALTKITDVFQLRKFLV